MLTALVIWRNGNAKSLLDFKVIHKVRKQSLITFAGVTREHGQLRKTHSSKCSPRLKHHYRNDNNIFLNKTLFNGSNTLPCCYHTTKQNSQSTSMSDYHKEKDKFSYSSAQPYYYTFPLIVGVQSLLIDTQAITGLPWWATIVSTTILLRFAITLPLARTQAITLAKTELLQPTMKEVIEALRHNITIKGKRKGQSPEEVQRIFRQEARKYTYDIYKRENCNPLKLYFLPWVQLPLWILISLALRNISGFFPKATECAEVIQHNPDLVTGGCLWMQDLTISDPYFILPVIIGLTNLLNIELNTLKRRVPSKRQQIITRVFRFLTVGMMFVASQVPAAMSLYWATSSSYGLAQNVFLLQPKIRRKLGIPQTPSESKRPFTEKFEILKTRVQDFMKIQRK